MTEIKTKYNAGQQQPEPPDLAAIEARLAAASVPPFDFEAFCALYGHAPADLRALLAELDAICHAAHMPDDYEHGLPSWINQHLYGKLVEWTDTDGGPIRRSEDIEEMERLRLALETEQHARRGAEQNAQHWQEVAQLAKVAT